MIECTADLFSALPDELKDLNQLTRRICPDMKNLKDKLRVKGLYSNPNERISFSILGVVCNDTLDATCASKEDIDEFLSYLQFTVYILNGNIDFG